MLLLMMLTLAGLPAEAVELPPALQAAIASRFAIATAEIAWSTTEPRRDPAGPASSREALYANGATVVFTTTQRTSPRTPDGEPFAVESVPLAVLNGPDGFWEYEPGMIFARYWPERQDSRLPDIRSFGLLPRPGAARAPDALVQSFVERLGSRVDFSEHRRADGLINVVALSDEGDQVTWLIDPDRGWNPLEIEWRTGAELRAKSVVTVAKHGDIWFPARLEHFFDDGAEPALRIEMVKVAINDPDHPATLTAADLGVEAGMQVLPQVPGLSKDGYLFWGGEGIISEAVAQARREAGQLKTGPIGWAFRRKHKPGFLESEVPEEFRLDRLAADCGRFPRDPERIRAVGVRTLMMSVWEAYTMRFIERYALAPDQATRAWSILRSCQVRAANVLLRQRGALDRAERIIRDPAADASARSKARKALDDFAQRIDKLFEEELKPRLERLPTAAQRRKVEESRGAPAQSSDKPESTPPQRDSVP